MENQILKCQRMIRFWQRRLDSLTVNVNAVNAVNAKEDEKGKETFPPAPPIENKGKVEETRTNIARARARFVPPTPEEVAAFCLERRNSVDPVLWWNFYAAKGWMIGKAKMVDWKRAVITWERTQKQARRVAPIDPKAAAFERQRAEAEERRRRAEALAASILERRRAELAKSEARHD